MGRSSLSSLVDLARTATDHRHIRYTMVSACAVVVSQVVLLTCNGLLGWSGTASNITAVTVSAVPSYLMNRYWVWGKRGRNHFWREVFPFWGMALIGLALSTLLVSVAERWNDSTVVVSLANLAAFGTLWVFKYFLLDAVLFKVVPDDPSLVVQ